MRVAIDENVLAVANDVSRLERGGQAICTHAGDECRLACVQFLAEARQSHVVLLDSQGVVLSYYRRKASLSGQPGSADVFLKYLYESQYSSTFVEILDVGVGPDFNLPHAIIQSDFDADDRIYVALALSPPGGVVVNAVDSDYADNGESLTQVGVIVRQLCV